MCVSLSHRYEYFYSALFISTLQVKKSREKRRRGVQTAGTPQLAIMSETIEDLKDVVQVLVTALRGNSQLPVSPADEKWVNRLLEQRRKPKRRE